MLEWVALSFSRGSSQPRDLTGSPTMQAGTTLSGSLGTKKTGKGAEDLKSVSPVSPYLPVSRILVKLNE